MSHSFGTKLPYDFNSFGKKLSHPHNMFTKVATPRCQTLQS